MINLFNIDIDKIRYGGSDISLIKLGGTVIYKATSSSSSSSYEPGQFQGDQEITEVRTIVNESNTNLSNMFSDCINLVSVNTKEFNTSNVRDMSFMFYNCLSLTSLDLSNFDTRKVTSMDRIVGNCSSLVELNLSNFNTKRCTTESSVGNGTSWLMPNCDNLYTLYLDNCNRYTISYILTYGDISHGNQYNPPEKLGVIYCRESMAKDLTPPFGWEFIFIQDNSSTELRLYNDIVDEFRGNQEITEVRTIVNESHTDLSYMFNDCINLASVNTQDWDVSNVTSMSNMFDGCKSLTSLDVSNWITDNVTDMTYMFFGCESLTSLDLSHFRTNNAIYINMMFCNCYNLEQLNISYFDLSKVMDTMFMFSGCNNLHKLYLNNCSNDTIRKIITSMGFPTNSVNGQTRTIYCKEENAVGLEDLLPDPWVFSYID